MSKTYGRLNAPTRAQERTLSGGDWIRSKLNTWNVEVTTELNDDDSGTVVLRHKTTGDIIDSVEFNAKGFVRP